MKEKQVDRGEGNNKEQAWKSRTLALGIETKVGK